MKGGSRRQRVCKSNNPDLQTGKKIKKNAGSKRICVEWQLTSIGSIMKAFKDELSAIKSRRRNVFYLKV
jgi:hypothetical protein